MQTESKFVLASKTVIGAIMMLIPLLIMATGGDPIPAEELAKVESNLNGILLLVSGLAGFGVTLWGRFTAKKTLNLEPLVKASPMLLAAVIVPMLLLGGCDTVRGWVSGGTGLTQEEQAQLTPKARLYQLQSEFNVVLAVSGRYAALPECGATVVGACHDAGAVANLQAAAVKTNAAIRLAQQVGTNDGNYAITVAAARIAMAELALYVTRLQLE